MEFLDSPKLRRINPSFIYFFKCFKKEKQNNYNKMGRKMIAHLGFLIVIHLVIPIELQISKYALVEINKFIIYSFFLISKRREIK